jgi:hypothetical protein
VSNKQASDENSDTVIGLQVLQSYNGKPNAGLDDARRGQINHQNVEKKINGSDTPNSKSIVFTVKPIEQKDVPQRT